MKAPNLVRDVPSSSFQSSQTTLGVHLPSVEDGHARAAADLGMRLCCLASRAPSLRLAASAQPWHALQVSLQHRRVHRAENPRAAMAGLNHASGPMNGFGHGHSTPRGNEIMHNHHACPSRPLQSHGRPLPHPRHTYICRPDCLAFHSVLRVPTWHPEPTWYLSSEGSLLCQSSHASHGREADWTCLYHKVSTTHSIRMLCLVVS